MWLVNYYVLKSPPSSVVDVIGVLHQSENTFCKENDWSGESSICQITQENEYM